MFLIGLIVLSSVLLLGCATRVAASSSRKLLFISDSGLFRELTRSIESTSINSRPKFGEKDTPSNLTLAFATAPTPDLSGKRSLQFTEKFNNKFQEAISPNLQKFIELMPKFKLRNCRKEPLCIESAYFDVEEQMWVTELHDLGITFANGKERTIGFPNIHRKGDFYVRYFRESEASCQTSFKKSGYSTRTFCTFDKEHNFTPHSNKIWEIKDGEPGRRYQFTGNHTSQGEVSTSHSYGDCTKEHGACKADFWMIARSDRNRFNTANWSSGCT